MVGMITTLPSAFGWCVVDRTYGMYMCFFLPIEHGQKSEPSDNRHSNRQMSSSSHQQQQQRHQQQPPQHQGQQSFARGGGSGNGQSGRGGGRGNGRPQSAAPAWGTHSPPAETLIRATSIPPLSLSYIHTYI